MLLGFLRRKLGSSVRGSEMSTDGANVEDVKPQKINLLGCDDQNTVEIEAKEVEIYPSANSALDCEHVISSNKIKLSPAVKFFWEYQYYVGKLICRHRYKPLIAYCINNKSSAAAPTCDNSMIRLRNTETAHKLLLKDFTGRVVSMEFAVREEPLLAVVDHSKTLYIFKVGTPTENQELLKAEILLILRPNELVPQTNHQTMTWCPWVPGSPKPSIVSASEPMFSVPDDPSMLIAISCGCKVDVLDVSIAAQLLRERYPEQTPVEDHAQGTGTLSQFGWTRDQLTTVLSERSKTHLAYLNADDHGDVITAVALSRDASCLASASLDGKVCIYSLLGCRANSDKGELSPIHVFSPHDGAPLYGLIFVDDAGPESASSTWSHLLTGAHFNRELRLWSCANWHCHQTLQFCPAVTCPVKSSNESGVPPALPNTRPSIIMALDRTATALVASDITRRVLYILELTRMSDNTSKGSGDEVKSSPGLRFASISEFLLTTPCILFALGNLERKTVSSSDYPSSSTSGTNTNVDLVSLEIHTIHTWHLLNGTITSHLPHRTGMNTSANQISPLKSLDNISTTVTPAQPTTEVPLVVSTDMSISELSDLTHVTPCPTSTTPFQSQDVGESLDLEKLQPKCEKSTTEGHDSDFQPAIEVTSDLDDIDLPPLRPSDFSQKSVSDMRIATPENATLDGDDNPEAPDIAQLSPLPPSTFKNADVSITLDDGVVEISSSLKHESGDHDGVPVESIEEAMVTRTLEVSGRATTEDPDAQAHRSRSPNPEELTKLSGDLQLFTADGDVRPDSPATCTDHDSALAARKLVTMAVNDQLPGAETSSHLTAPDGTSINHWASGGLDIKPYEKSLRTENNWSTMTIFSSQCELPSSSSSSASSASLTPEAPLKSSDSGLQFHAAPSPTELPEQGASINSESMESVIQLLRLLVSDTENRTQQMNLLFDKLADARNQLDQLAQTQSELVKRLDVLQQQQQQQQDVASISTSHRASNRHGYASEPEGLEPSASSQSMPRHGAGVAASPFVRPRQVSSSSTEDVSTTPDWAQQILLQLRSQQGDFARRCMHLEGMVNKVSSMTNELSQSYRHLHTKSMIPATFDSRLDQLPKLTCDLVRPVLRAEMQNTFVSNVNRLVEPMQKSMLHVIQDCLNPLPSTLADNVCRLLREKNFTVQFARATSSALTADLTGAYRDSLQRVFVPALDKNINRLFEELNAIFKTGTQQYLQQVGQRAQPIPDSTELASMVVTQLIPEIQNLWISMNVDTPAKALGQGKPSIKETLVNRPSQTKARSPARTARLISDEIKPPFTPTKLTASSKKAAANALDPGSNASSGPCPPEQRGTPTLKIRDDVARPLGQAQKLIQQDKLVEALELALISTNQELVLDVCSDIDPDKLFGSGNYLIAQNILLSLIHQMSCGDLGVQLDLKLRYLQEAVLSLDKNDPTTLEHGPRIIGLLARRLENFLHNACNDTSQGVPKISAAFQCRILKLQRAAKWIFDNTSKTNG